MIMAIFTASVQSIPGALLMAVWCASTTPCHTRAFPWSGCSPTNGILTVPTDRRVLVRGHVRPITPMRLCRVEAMSAPIRVMIEHGEKQAVLYEVIAKGTAEEYVSDRRRQHRAFQ